VQPQSPIILCRYLHQPSWCRYMSHHHRLLASARYRYNSTPTIASAACKDGDGEIEYAHILDSIGREDGMSHLMSWHLHAVPRGEAYVT
jgi:hypothetical protein